MYQYYGLPPEEGFNYALYTCPNCSTTFISNKGVEMYCPSCGGVVEFVRDMAETDLPEGIHKVGICKTCNSELATSEESINFENLHCPQCGDTNLELISENENKEQKKQETANQQTVAFMTPEEVQNVQSEIDLQMTFHDSPETGPFWNVIINGTPVARIYLKDQPNYEEIRDVFVSEKYPTAIREAVKDFGIMPTLQSINARFYAVDENKLREKVEAEVKKKYETKFREQFSEMALNFKRAVALVIAGLNKNIWPDVSNPLKEALYEELAKVGVEKPEVLIESAFAKGAEPFFDAVLSKAVEVMSKPQEVRAELENLIENAKPAEPNYVKTSYTSPTIEEMPAEQVRARLIRGNFVIVPPSAKQETTYEEVKKAFKNIFRRV